MKNPKLTSYSMVRDQKLSPEGEDEDKGAHAGHF